MISKEQAKILTDIKNNKIPNGFDFYNSNKLLISLVEDEYVNQEIKWIKVPIEYDIVGYNLTPKGINELSLYNEQKKNDLKNNFMFPLLVSVISFVAGMFIQSIFNLIKW